MNKLPIDDVVPQISEAFIEEHTLVLQAPPGAGKSTRLPLELLYEPWLESKTILMLQPRRLAARAVATRMAEVRGEEPGLSVGYRVRFDSKVSARTRIEVVTEGILNRRLQHDPELKGVGLVIFDEFHERHLHSDLGLALCLDVQENLRGDLRLLVMSATLDGKTLARKLRAPLIESSGSSYPVEVEYLPVAAQRHLHDKAIVAIDKALKEEKGDILVFLPGAREIRQVEAAMAAKKLKLAICPLYSNLSHKLQNQAIAPDPRGRRKLVLATPIAETSLTIEGIGVVIDSGYHRAPRFDPNSGLGRLELLRVSRASAIQRSGRAGRLGPGVCFRLWSSNTQHGLIPHEPPEIEVADLAPLALDLALWGVRDAKALRWIDAPPSAALAQARALLQELGAIDEQLRITPFGEKMAHLPLHPRLSHMLLRARPLKLGDSACDVAALLTERDILRDRDHPSHSDFGFRLELIHSLRRDGIEALRARGGEMHSARTLERAITQIRRLANMRDNTALPRRIDAGVLLALAYPDRIALRREGDDREAYLLASGSGARLPPGQSAWELIVAADLEGAAVGRRSEARIRISAPLDRRDLKRLYPEQHEWRPVLQWDSREQAVRAEDQYCYRALVLERRPLQNPDPEALGRAMLEGIREMGLEALPWDAQSRQLQARLESLRQWMPEEAWPDCSDAALLEGLEEWLGPYLNGVSRRAHLAKLDLGGALLARLEWSQQQRLEQLAPSHIGVPSGSRKRLEYSSDGEAPVLAVKLQEMFGLADTPSVAEGYMPVMLHLLSPAQRPIQVTQDLKGFWERTYSEVKKELKGRYPKHPWPDDPWGAPATARAKPRG